METSISWTGNSRREHERTGKWYIVASITVVLLFIYSIVSSAWTFTILIAMTTAMYLYLHRHKPSQKTIKIDEKGITFDGVFSPWSSYTGFRMLKTPGYNELQIKLAKNKAGPDLAISIKSEDEERIRTTLEKFIPEIANKNENTLDKIIRVCKL